MNVRIKTPIKRANELNIYSNKNVFLRTSKYLEVSSNKLNETVKIGIITSKEIINELKNHIFKYLNILNFNISLYKLEFVCVQNQF